MEDVTMYILLLALFSINLVGIGRDKSMYMDKRRRIHTFMVLSAPPVIRRVPVWSKVEQNTPASASNEPGCGTSSIVWNGVPVA